MYAMNIQNDVIGLVLRQNCKSKQVTDFIAWPSRCHVTILHWATESEKYIILTLFYDQNYVNLSNLKFHPLISMSHKWQSLHFFLKSPKCCFCGRRFFNFSLSENGTGIAVILNLRTKQTKCWRPPKMHYFLTCRSSSKHLYHFTVKWRNLPKSKTKFQSLWKPIWSSLCSALKCFFYFIILPGS